MAGRKDTSTKKTTSAKKSKTSVVVMSDSSDSDSLEVSLKSQMHKQNQIKKPESESGSEPEEVVADSEGEDEEIEKSNGNGKLKGKEVEKSESALYKLPMRRISRIIKSENADMRITHEATFLINKATEKFLELFAKEAYACAFLDRKNQVGYNHLSRVVAKRRRFDFLSDFVPEQVKAEDALAELAMNEK